MSKLPIDSLSASLLWQCITLGKPYLDTQQLSAFSNCMTCSSSTTVPDRRNFTSDHLSGPADDLVDSASASRRVLVIQSSDGRNPDQPQEKVEWQGGEVVMCGSTDWGMVRWSCHWHIRLLCLQSVGQGRPDICSPPAIDLRRWVAATRRGGRQTRRSW